MEKVIDVVMNVLVQRQALNAAATGNVTGIVIVIDYIFLLSASIIGLAVIIERAVRLRKDRLIDEEMFKVVPQRVQEGDLDGAAAVCRQSKSILGSFLSVELDEYKTGHVPIEEAMDTASDAADNRLFANLDILGTIAKMAPLLGLLGTVLGMMYAFSQLDIGMRKETLAQGITSALDTTVRGLIIAIVCLTFERRYQRRIEKASQSVNVMLTSIVRAARRNKK